MVFLGLTITSSWGNGHATTFRGLCRELSALGHDVLFLERDKPWYAGNRDMPSPRYCRAELYESVEDLARRFGREVHEADFVLVGSYVPDGVAVGEWVAANARGVTAFYDIDTPVTLGKLARGDYEYLRPDLVPCFDLYLSFTGGPTLERIERELSARRARALYCSVDPELYFPEGGPQRWDLGYLGTYSDDRQPTVERLLVEPARRWRDGRFAVAGPLYPPSLRWPSNVDRTNHVPPAEHRAFYNAQRFTLNVTRRDMVEAGYSPSVRLFEAAACGVPILSDAWSGLETVLEPGSEVLVVSRPEDVVQALREMSEADRSAMAERGRRRVLAEHTAAHRATELVEHVIEVARR